MASQSMVSNNGNNGSNGSNGETAKVQSLLPTDKTLQQAMKLSLKLTKPIDTYFYIDSLKGNIMIKPMEGEEVVYKNDDEHTSSINSKYKSDHSLLIVTDNTIYILSDKTKFANNDSSSSS